MKFATYLAVAFVAGLIVGGICSGLAFLAVIAL